MRIKINNQIHQIRLEVTIEDCRNQSKLPKKFFQYSIEKMKNLIADYEINVYEIKDRLANSLWKQIARLEIEGGETKEPVSIVLAQGAPFLTGIIVKKNFGAKFGGSMLGRVSFDAPATTIKKWPFEWVLLNVNRSLFGNPEKSDLDCSFLRAAYFAAIAGENITEYPLYRLHSYDTKSSLYNEAFTLYPHKDLKLMLVAINDIKEFDEDFSTVDQLYKAVKREQKYAYSDESQKLTILKRHIANRIYLALNSPRRWGLNMPIHLICAMVFNADLEEENLADSDFSTEIDLKLKLLDHKMKAVIHNFPIDIVGRFRISIDERWLRDKIRDKGIIFGVSDDLLNPIIERIKKRQSPDGLPVALGQHGTAGDEPYLVKAIHQDVKSQQKNQEKTSEEKDGGNEFVSIVRKGELVAEIAYGTPPILSHDIFGNQFAPLSDSLGEIELGKGIVREKDGKFYSTIMGKLELEKHNIFVKTLDVHEGNINANTGDIVHEGSLEITGSIDTGMHVTVSGDLIVRKSIRAEYVSCAGNLIVEGGIIASKESMVETKGDITAGYIQDSRVVSNGSIYVDKAVIGSEVIAARNIESIGDETHIYGSSVYCGGNLKVEMLGRDSSSKTIVQVGIDSYNFMKILQLNEEQKESQISKIESERKLSTIKDKELQEAQDLERLVAELVSKLSDIKSRIKGLEESAEPDKFAEIQVSGVMTENCQLTVGGTELQVPAEYRNVRVTGRMVRGSNFNSLSVDKEKAS